jgi:ATP-dependent exoDNAse (exonuclease V) beta subunit
MIQDIPAPFQIFNASAGSGKTFLLVQQYLTKLLSSRTDENFNRMLALTFTNKAVFEMKYRILLQLHDLASQDPLDQANPMGKILLETLEISPQELQQKAKRSLQIILHDYAAFDVITLDSFMHRVIRTFARDLGLSYNFDITLEVDDFLEEIVDRVLDRVGEAPDLTRILEQFTFEKMDDEATTSWELKKNLIDAAKLLLNENDRTQIQRIALLSLSERKKQQEFLQYKYNSLVVELTTIGETALKFFKEHGLEAVHFNRKTLYNRFLKLSKGVFDGFDAGQLYQNMQEGKPLYPMKVDGEVQQSINRLSGQIIGYFEKALNLFFQWQLIKDIKKQWIPLNLLTSLSRELEDYQNETNKVLLSTFNERIANEILLQPTPYIYERLGENYRHYFLDEFQDTSSLQWKNLIPLIETALTSLNEDNRSGSLLLVGDPKQSIYRWRGGDVNQFIDLTEEGSPFQIEKKVNHLAINYRSAQSIVAFNNVLYQCLTQHLEYPENKTLFGERAQQAVFSNKEGYVKLTFFPEEKVFEENPYTKRIVKDIEQCKQQGYSFLDMVVLVRKKKQADLIAVGLSNEGIPTITSNSLRLEENTQVKFLASLLQLYFNPNDLAIKKDHLSFLYPTKERKEDLHQFLLDNISRDIEQVWKAEEISFNFSFFDHRTVMIVFEKACFLFPGIEMANPFVKAFLDLAFDFSQNEQANTLSFLQFWEKKRATQSLTIPENSIGVKILTIHQAKGLEFPIVFFPYADSLIHSNHQEKVWLSPQSLLGDKFSFAWVGYSKRLLNYGEEGEKVYHQKRQEDEMDAWNVFYVATTRASQQLYLYASDENKEKESYVNVLMELFPDAEIQQENQLIYEWGKRLGQSIKAKKASNNKGETVQSSTAYPYEQKLVLQMSRTEELESARLLGLRIHDLLGKINYQEEIESVLKEAYLQGEISQEEQIKLQSLLNELMQSDVLRCFYTRDYKILNEKAILVPQHGVLRPDRVGVGDVDAYVIDYKTGKEKPEHAIQVKAYAKWIEKITQKKVNKFLVYLDIKAKKSINVLTLS